MSDMGVDKKFNLIHAALPSRPQSDKLLSVMGWAGGVCFSVILASHQLADLGFAQTNTYSKLCIPVYVGRNDNY